MPRYAIWAKVGASVKVGEYEAESPEEALRMADEDGNASWSPSLCHLGTREDAFVLARTAAEEIGQ